MIISNYSLTLVQEEMLFEMCKKLFPEVYSDDRNIFDIRNGDNGVPIIMVFEPKSYQILHTIPLLEFCLRTLLPKIFNSGYMPFNEEEQQGGIGFDDLNGTDEMLYPLVYNHKFHPVDFLYEWYNKMEFSESK